MRIIIIIPLDHTLTITPKGLIWANERGVFIFEGSAPKNITFGRCENMWQAIVDKTLTFAEFCKYNNSYWLSLGTVAGSTIMVYNIDMDYWTLYIPKAIYGFKRFYLGINGVFYIVTHHKEGSNYWLIACEYVGSQLDYYRKVQSGLTVEELHCPVYFITQRLYDNNDIQKVFTKIDIKCLYNDTTANRPKVSFSLDGIQMTSAGIGSDWTSLSAGNTTGHILLNITAAIKEITVPIPYTNASDIQIRFLHIGSSVSTIFRTKSITVYYEPVDELKQ